MLLYLDDQLISDDAIAQELDEVLDGLEAKHHYTVMLHDDSVDVVMEANGNPAKGYRLTYSNLANKGRVISDEGIQPLIVKKILHSFLAGESDWQYTIGWHEP